MSAKESDSAAEVAANLATGREAGAGGEGRKREGENVAEDADEEDRKEKPFGGKEEDEKPNDGDGGEKESGNDAKVLGKVEQVLVEEFGLAAFGKVIVQKWLKKMAQDPRGLEHVRDWFLLLLNGRRPAKETISTWQWGCPDIVPGLTARPFWDAERSILPFLNELEAKTDVVADELRRMQGKPVFQPYRAPTWANPARQAPDGIGSLGHTSGDWDVCYLFLHNVDFKDNLALFPETAALIKGIPGWYKHAFFSVLAPDTHIAQHHGPTNKKLRVHLPLVVPPGECSGIRVGPEKRIFERGSCLVFDDSFEHEAWNAHSSQARICLILDIWHPDLSEQEVNLLRFLEKAKMHRAKRLCAAHQVSSVDAEQALGGEDENNGGKNGDGDASSTVPVLPENENFYALLERTKAMRKSANLSVP